jgi:hypothetical protein
MNDSNFWRAHEAYYNVPDEDDFDTCQECENGKVPNPDYDPGETRDGMMEDQFCDCDNCKGTGEVNTSARDREDYEERRQDAADDRAEAERDERITREMGEV